MPFSFQMNPLWSSLGFGIQCIQPGTSPVPSYDFYFDSVHVKLLRLNENFISSSFGHQKINKKGSTENLYCLIWALSFRICSFAIKFMFVIGSDVSVLTYIWPCYNCPLITVSCNYYMSAASIKNLRLWVNCEVQGSILVLKKKKMLKSLWQNTAL